MAVESVVASKYNRVLIEQVAKLWIKPGDLVVDVTAGRQKWWSSFRPDDLICHDIDKDLGDGVDFRALPEETGSVDVVAFDPPYTSVGGRETSTATDMLERYGLINAPKTPAGVDSLIEQGVDECARVLVQGGRLLLKTADYISSGKYHAGHLHAVNHCLYDGYFTILDEFIHHSGTGPQPTENLDGSPRRQIHSRRAHSFLTVLGRTKVAAA